MISSDLMDFRTAYLRIIARTWVDSEFRGKVVGANSEQIRQLFINDYDFDWCWPALDPIFEEAGAEWRPERVGGWRGKGFSGKLTVKLPLNKKCVRAKDPEKMALALADFYALRPTLFGNGKRWANSMSFQAYPTSLGNEGDFQEFGAVILRALGLAWSEGPDGAFTQKLQDTTSCLPALAGWLGYTTPWNMAIVVEDDPDAVWEPLDGKDSRQNGWQIKPHHSSSEGLNPHPPAVSLRKNTLVLHIPHRPDDADQEFFPVALAAYNQTGPAYPFTCCP